MGNIEFKRTLQDLLVPACIITLVFFLRPYVELLNSSPFWFEVGAILLLIIPGFFSLKFKQFKAFYLILSLTMGLTALTITSHNLIPADMATTTVLQQWIIVLIALNLLFIKIFKISGIFTKSSQLFIVIIITEAILLFWGYNTNQFVLVQPALLINIALPFTTNPLISPLALALISVVIVIQLAMLFFQNSSIQTSLLGSLLLLSFAFYFIEQPYMLALAVTGIAIMFSAGIAQDSHDMAFIDTLTKLPGRRSMEQELKQLGKRYCIAMLDIDHFKKLNDKYGHDVGDQVLKMVAKNIKKVSGGGKPARYGGEEFAIIFPGKTLLDVVPHLESVRLHIENTPFALRDKDRPKKLPKKVDKRSKSSQDHINVTISMGVAERTRLDRSTEQVMKAADNALYKAKKQGRNKISY